MRDTMKNCLNLDSRPLPKVTNACVLWSKPEQGKCFYECKNERRFLRSHSESRIRVSENKRSESGNTDHRTRRSTAAQLLARSGERDLREMPLVFAVPDFEGKTSCTAGARCGVGSSFGCSASHFVISACICGVARSSQSSRTNCSKYAVRSLKCRSRISNSIIFLNAPVSRRLDGLPSFAMKRLCVRCSAWRKTN